MSQSSFSPRASRRRIARELKWSALVLTLAVASAGNAVAAGPVDLWKIQHGASGTGRTELHIMDGATNFSTFIGHPPTAEGLYTDRDVEYAVADFNRDGSNDLWKIQHGTSWSGRTEVHITDGASGFQLYDANVVTADGLFPDENSEYAVADFNRDGRPDLWKVQHGVSGTGRTEVHIMDGASDFRLWLANVATADGLSPDADSEYVVADFNRDGRPDLWKVQHRVSGTNRTEVHIMDGASDFRLWLANVPTADWLMQDDENEYAAADYNGDGRPDLWKVQHGASGTGRTELHIMDGASDFRLWLGHPVTVDGLAPDNVVEYAVADYTPPEDDRPRIVRLAGGLWYDRYSSDPAGAGLYRAVESLDVRAADDGSSVASIELLVDGRRLRDSHFKSIACCPKVVDASFELTPAELSAGRHVVTVRVRDPFAYRPWFDPARHTETRSWEVLVPRLPDETGDELPTDEIVPVPEESEAAECPPDPDFTDPLYCEPPLGESFDLVNQEPGVADATETPTVLTAEPTGIQAAAAPRAPSSTCWSAGAPDLGSTINGKPRTVSGRWGLSDQNGFDGEHTFGEFDSAGTLLNPNPSNAAARALKVKRVRIIVPFDLIAKTRELATLKPDEESYYCTQYRKTWEWIRYVTSKPLHMEPLISFEHSKVAEPVGGPRGTVQPTPSEYRAHFRAFSEQFPIVRLYTAFNEPNHPDHGPFRYVAGDPAATARNAAAAGKLWAVANAYCRKRIVNGVRDECQVGAGDFSDQPVYTGKRDRAFPHRYLRHYWQGMGRKRPLWWAFHVYFMIKTREDTLGDFLKWSATRGRSVWITEAGSYRFARGPKAWSVDEQAQKLTYFFRSEGTFAQNSGSSGRIKRFYYYPWHSRWSQPPEGAEDTGLLEWNLSCYRPIYLVYLKRTNPSAAPPNWTRCT